MNAGLGKLALVTAVVLAALVVVSLDRDSGAPEERGQVVAAELAASLNDATTLELTGAEGTLTLERQGVDWSLAEWDGYPASFSEVKELLVGLSTLEIVEAMTARPANHAKLGLAEPGSGEGAGTRLVVRAADGSVLADVIAGDRREGQLDQLYVRRAGEDQTWLATGGLRPPAGAVDLVDTELLRLKADDMVAVTITPPEGDVVRAVEDADGAWALADPPAGRVVKSTAGFAGLAGALAYVDMEAVVPQAELPAGLAWTTTRFDREDGLTVEARVARADEQAFLRVDVRQDEPRLPAPEPPVADASASAADAAVADAAVADADAPGEADAGQADAAAPSTDAEATDTDAAAAIAQAAAERHAAAVQAARGSAAASVAELSHLAGWTYRISTWKADALTKSLEDFLEPLPEPEAPVAPAPDGDDQAAAGSFDALHEAGLIGPGDVGPAGDDG